jgi:hypothetical protein
MTTTLDHPSTLPAGTTPARRGEQRPGQQLGPDRDGGRGCRAGVRRRAGAGDTCR